MKYQVTQENGAVQTLEAALFEFDWKSKNLSNNKDEIMNAIFYKDSKKYEPIAYLSRVKKIEEIK